MIEIRDGIMFVFYSGLPHMYFIREMSTVTMANSITGDSPHSSQVPHSQSPLPRFFYTVEKLAGRGPRRFPHVKRFSCMTLVVGLITLHLTYTSRDTIKQHHAYT